jgi:hypothetical protein
VEGGTGVGIERTKRSFRLDGLAVLDAGDIVAGAVVINSAFIFFGSGCGTSFAGFSAIGLLGGRPIARGTDRSMGMHGCVPSGHRCPSYLMSASAKKLKQTPSARMHGPCDPKHCWVVKPAPFLIRQLRFAVGATVVICFNTSECLADGDFTVMCFVGISTRLCFVGFAVGGSTGFLFGCDCMGI